MKILEVMLPIFLSIRATVKVEIFKYVLFLMEKQPLMKTDKLKF